MSETAIAERNSTTIGMTSTPRAASFTSLAWIFLPRYSGVRPTINPPMNTVMMAISKIVYIPLPTPPGVISPSIIPVSRKKPPIEVNESFDPETDPVEVWVEAML